LPRREFDTHKGQAGRVGILAGSRGKLGAAHLAAEGALRAGAGLVTLLVRQDAYPLLAVSMPPEVMVAPVSDYRQALDGGFDVLAIGPGLGFDAEDEILDVICTANIPAVVDADALTTMAKAGFDALRTMQGPRLLTPHPGEMRRFTQHRPEWRNMPRRELAEAFAAELPGHVCLLKGARTVIAKVGESTCCNTTGHPGMATGGMGDTLTGVCAALLGQGIPVHHAAGTGAWICGRAAERAALEMAEEAVLPTDVAAHIGAAWRDAVWACF
jgi:NAD(P)H-hydrate epimerase